MRVKNEKAPYSTTTGRPGKFRIGVHSSEMGKITKKGGESWQKSAVEWGEPCITKCHH